MKRTPAEDCFLISRRSSGEPQILSPSEEELFYRLTKRSGHFLRKTRSSRTKNCADYFMRTPENIVEPLDLENQMSLFSLSW